MSCGFVKKVENEAHLRGDRCKGYPSPWLRFRTPDSESWRTDAATVAGDCSSTPRQACGDASRVYMTALYPIYRVESAARDSQQPGRHSTRKRTWVAAVATWASDMCAPPPTSKITRAKRALMLGEADSSHATASCAGCRAGRGWHYQKVEAP